MESAETIPETPARTVLPAVALHHLPVWILFFVSGACGLIYEVLWCRLLGLVFGNTVQSLSAVLTAFMGGLALGSYVAGRYSHKLKRPLLVYGVLELLIGLYCALLPMVLGDGGPIAVLYRSLYGESGNSSLSIVRFLISFVLLLIPTTFMGATLPVLSQFMVRSAKSLGRTVGALYAVNTFGAVMGAAATGFILLPELGKIRTNWLAVTCNIILGIIGIYLGNREIPALGGELPESNEAASAVPEIPKAPISRAALLTAVVTFGLTGFAAMAIQIGWTRAISLSTGSSSYAFSLIVSVFILGLSFGGMWASRVAPRTPDPVALLAKVLLAMGFFGLVVAFFLGFGPLIFFFLLAWGSQSSWNVLLAFEAGGIALLIIVPTFLMGATMPLTLQVASRFTAHAGRTVGNIYSANTAGAILGSLLGGLVLLPFLHTQITLELMSLFYAIPGVILFLLSASRNEPRQRGQMAIICGCFLAMTAISIFVRWDPALLSSGIYLLRDPARLRAAREFRFMDASPEIDKSKILFYREGAAATVSVEHIGDDLSMRVGGKPEATTYGDMNTQVGLTLVPELLHPTGPKDVLVIGLGSGISAGAALAPDSIQRVDVVEMSPEVVRGSWYFRDYSGLKYSEDDHWIETPKMQLTVNDGRNHLLLTSRKYDVIASEPSNPWMAGVGNLFTKEAFTLAKNRLNPGGLMCQWVQSYSLEEADFFSIIRTFGEVFPHMQLWCVNRKDFLLIGSDSETRFTPAELKARIGQPRVKEVLKGVHFDNIYEVLASFVAGTQELSDKVHNAPIHTDDNMLLEFSAPKSLYSPSKSLDSTRFVTIPETLVDLKGLDAAARSEFYQKLDLVVASREHFRYGYDMPGPGLKDKHLDVSYLLDPYQRWAIDHKVVQGTERADRLLAGAGEGTGEPDPASAVKVLEEAGKRAGDLRWRKSLLNEALAEQAIRLLNSGRADDAEQALKCLDRIDTPKQKGVVAVLRTKALLAKKDYDGAYARLEEASKLGASPLECADLAVKILLAKGDGNGAMAAIDQILSQPTAQYDPKTALLWKTKAELLLGSKQIDDAQQCIRRAVLLAPMNQEYTLLKAHILYQSGFLAEGLENFRRQAALDPANTEARAQLAGALIGAANTALEARPPAIPAALTFLRYARRSSREICALNPEWSDGWQLLCRAFLGLEKCDPDNAAFYRGEARQALLKAQAVLKPDAKLPDDLASALKSVQSN